MITVDPNPAKVGDVLTISAKGVGGAEQSVLTTALAGDDNDLTFTAVTPGVAGDSITITYVDPAGINQALSVGVVATDITVNLATDGASAPSSTAAEIKAEIEATAAAAALVTVEFASGNDGTGIPVAMVQTPLAGGVDGTATTLAFRIMHMSDPDNVLEETVTLTQDPGSGSSSGDFNYEVDREGVLRVQTVVDGDVDETLNVQVYT